jgi:hypothetical protein
MILFHALETQLEQAGLGAGPRAGRLREVIGVGRDPLLWRSPEPSR